MPTILDKIVATKYEEIAQAKVALAPEALRERMAEAPAARDFFGAIRCAKGVALIAEVKKASPSKGLIREDFQPVEIAKTYAAHGATCISVLTDEQYFQGHLDFLRAIRREVDIPLLRKDFVIDPYQVWEARDAGADAVLLIAECLDDASLQTLHDEIVSLGMTPLVELHDSVHLRRVIDIGAQLIGINNRDLHTFEVDIHRTIELRAQIPEERAVVGESGIGTHEDVKMLEAAGVSAMLVGESLMRQENVGSAVDRLLGH